MRETGWIFNKFLLTPSLSTSLRPAALGDFPSNPAHASTVQRALLHSKISLKIFSVSFVTRQPG